MGKLFGTDGIRGEYNKQITGDLVERIAYFGSKILPKSENPSIVIGIDPRESSYDLVIRLINGVTKAGADALYFGIIPTPAISTFIDKYDADAGIMITASHNSYEFNGIKFFNQNGQKLPNEIEEQIENEYFNGPVLPESGTGKIYMNLDKDLYVNNLKENFKPDLTGKKIVVDTSNGSLSNFAHTFFDDLNADVVYINNQPNGKNINDHCGSTHIETLKQAVLKEKADFGFTFDGDGDRCLAVDNLGETIDGDIILYLLAKKKKAEGSLNEDTIVVTKMSNVGLIKALKKLGIKAIKTDVGDHNVLQEMLKEDYTLGGEQAGHIIDLDYNRTGDGLQTAAELSEIFANSDTDVHELAKEVTIYPQKRIDVKVKEEQKKKYEEFPEIKQIIEESIKEIGDRGDIFIRASGTEPIVRVTIQGEDQEEINHYAKKIAEVIEEKIGI